MDGNQGWGLRVVSEDVFVGVAFVEGAEGCPGLAFRCYSWLVLMDELEREREARREYPVGGMYWRGSSQIMQLATVALGNWTPQVAQIARSFGSVILFVLLSYRGR